MNFIARKAEIFAILFLIFAGSISAEAQSSSAYRLPAGTRIKLAMDAGISSKVSSVNDTFTATVKEAVRVDDVVVLPFGSVVEGRVTEVRGAGYGSRNGRLRVRFETIRLSPERRRSIDGVLVADLRPGSTVLESTVSVFGGVAAGALIGAASGKENGVFAGAGLGAGAGAAVAYLKKGKEVFLRTDEEFEIELKREVTLPASDY